MSFSVIIKANNTTTKQEMCEQHLGNIIMWIKKLINCKIQIHSFKCKKNRIQIQYTTNVLQKLLLNSKMPKKTFQVKHVVSIETIGK